MQEALLSPNANGRGKPKQNNNPVIRCTPIYDEKPDPNDINPTLFALPFNFQFHFTLIWIEYKCNKFS